MEGRILVVHRNELILDVIQEMLQNVGYDTTLMHDGPQALARALSETFCLIIVDRKLDGDFDGAGLVERLHRYGIRTPIIGTSPETAWLAPPGAPNADVDQFLPAPFGYDDLIRAAERLLKRSLMPRVAPEPLPAPEPDPIDPADRTPARPAASRPASPASFSVQPVQNPAGIKRWEPRAIVRHQGPPRLLLVDNEDPARQRLARGLRAAGFDVSDLKTGQEAYEATMLNDYELILTDLWLVGDMDGFQMIDAMRKSGVAGPIAVLTSYITREMVQELLEYRVCKVLLKPARPEVLLAFIRQTARVAC